MSVKQNGELPVDVQGVPARACLAGPICSVTAAQTAIPGPLGSPPGTEVPCDLHGRWAVGDRKAHSP